MNNENYYAEGIHPNKNLENWFSNSIIVIKSNRTPGYAYFKIRQPKPKLLSAIDEKTKNLSDFQKE
jgi:hypothetical protein